MIGGPSLGVVLRDNRIAVVAVVRGRLSQAFTLEAQENPAAVLRAELDARRIKAGRAWVGLQRRLATVKALELPPVVGGSLAQMVAFELERHLPFPAEEATFDFLPLPSPRRAPQLALLVACERRTVDRALRLLEEARLAPRAITVACHDLVALVGRWPKTKRVVWIHLVGDEAELLFLEGSHLYLSRSIPAQDEAELTNEIAKSLLLLRWDEAGEFWVSGDRAQQLLASHDLAALGIPVMPPPLSPRASAAVTALGESANGLTVLALATAFGPRQRPLNLLPAALRPRQLSRAQVVTLSNAAAAAILGLSVLLAQGCQEQRHLARLNETLRALDPEVKSVERLIGDFGQKHQLLTTLETAQASALHPLPLLRELTELIPPDTWLSTLSLDAQGVELTGQATAANQLIPMLEGSPSLEKVEFASPVTKGRDKEQFRIKAAWEKLPKPPTPTPPAASPAAKPRGARSQ
jgi:general secretion pathway protein L